MLQADRRFLTFAVVAFGVFVGCRARAPHGAQCTFNGDCAESLVCAARVCRAACMSESDCRTGETCVPGGPAGASVCVRVADTRPCRYDSDCELAEPTRTLRCATDNMCRAACRADYDCQVYDFRLTCMPDGVCSMRPPPPDAGLDVGIDGSPDAPADVPPDLGPVSTPVAVWPPATAHSTSRLVRFRFTPGMGTDATRIEFCLDVACRTLSPIVIDVPAAMPPAVVAMAPVGTVFWRLVGLQRSMPVTARSAPRLITVPARAAPVSSTSGLRVDFNGDGQTDILIGAPQTNSVAGRAYALAVGATGMTSWTRETIEFPTGTQGLGRSVQPAGDINGDGFGDVVIAAPDRDLAVSRVQVRLGSRTGVLAAAPIDLAPPPPSAGSLFGVSIAAGDFNGDGFSDVVVGDPNAGSTAGAVYLYLGSASGLPTSASRTLMGAVEGQDFGAALTAPGDLDADGYDDLIVAWPGPTGGSSTAQWYRGTSDAAVLMPSGTLNFTSSLPGDPTIAGLGDVTGDGYPDLAIGAPGARGDEGEVRIQPGGPMLDPMMQTVLVDPMMGRTISFGSTVAGLGDVDGDGFRDFAVAGVALSSSGAVFVYRGGTTLGVTPVQVIDEPAPGGFLFGAALASIDHDGDGTNELYVGAPHFNVQIGGIHVFRRTTIPRLFFEPTPMGTFGMNMDDGAFGDSIGHSTHGG